MYVNVFLSLTEEKDSDNDSDEVAYSGELPSSEEEDGDDDDDDDVDEEELSGQLIINHTCIHK